jgi:hypothetical protein
MIGRWLGWVFIVIAMTTASADAVMALGDGAYEGLAAGEVWTLLSGQSPTSVYDGEGIPALLSLLARHVMDMPTWVVVGPVGLGLLLIFRKRTPKRLMFRSRMILR